MAILFFFKYKKVPLDAILNTPYSLLQSRRCFFVFTCVSPTPRYILKGKLLLLFYVNPIYSMYKYRQWLLFAVLCGCFSVLVSKRFLVLRFSVNQLCVYMSKRQQPHRDENVSPMPSIGLQWTTKKPL